jgi:hypothetical protein
MSLREVGLGYHRHMALTSTTRSLTAALATMLACACDPASTADGGTHQDGGSHTTDGGAPAGNHDASVAHGDAGSSTHGSGGTGGAGGTGGSKGGSDGGTSDSGASTPGGGSIVRTLAYHQVSTFTANPTGQPTMAADGSRIVYTIAPGTEDPATPNEIYVINADGSGNKKVDSYKSNCFCGSTAVISGDSSTIASTDATQVRVVGTDATMKGALNFDSNEVWNIAVSQNGGTVFVLQRRDNKITGGAAVERGIWAADASGGNHHQLVGPSAIATLVGTTADKVFPFAGCGKSMEFSSDGTRGVFAVEIGSMGQFAMTIANGTVSKLEGPVQFVKQVAISGDGTKVAVWKQDMGGEEVAVMNFDGSKSNVITTQSQGSCSAPLTLNADGSQLLSGDSALLFPTAGGDPVSLYLITAGDGVAVGSPAAHSVEAFFSMAADAKHFAYWNYDAATIMQIGLLELDPKDLGAAPAVSSPALSVASIPRDRSVGSSVSCKISGNTLDHAGTAVLLHGIEDTTGGWVAGQHVLSDDGMASDKTAHDGVFTADPITCGDGGEVGLRVVRIKAEAKAADGRRHATAIDISGLEVK